MLRAERTYILENLRRGVVLSTRSFDGDSSCVSIPLTNHAMARLVRGPPPRGAAPHLAASHLSSRKHRHSPSQHLHG